MQTNQQTLTRIELANELGVSVFTLNRWAVNGKGPRSLRVGRQTVYRRDDIEAYVATLSGQKAPTVTGPGPAEIYMMRMPEVQAVTGLAKSTIYRLIAEKQFPAAVKIGQRAVAFPSNLVQQWLSDRIGGAA